mgnify:CR=1 FL=1
MDGKKYEFTGETIEFGNQLLKRIRALRTLTLAHGAKTIHPGTLGGWIANENNLSHDGNAWVEDDAWVYGDAQVSDNVWIFGEAWIFGHAKIWGTALIYDRAWVFGDAKVSGDAHICGNSYVFENAKVREGAQVCDYARIYGDAIIDGQSLIRGSPCIAGTAKVGKTTDYLTITPIGSREDITTFFRNQEGGIAVNCGCFYDTMAEFAEKVDKTHGDSKHGQVYKLAIKLAKKQLEESGNDARRTANHPRKT